MIRYYSEVSKGEVTEAEAIKQIIDLCDLWYRMSHRSESLGQYLKEHTDLLDIDQWNCFRKID